MKPRSLTIDEAVERSVNVAEVVIEVGATARVAEVFRRQFDADKPAFLISDENTRAATGSAIRSVLEAAGITVLEHVLPARPRPKPTVELATRLAGILGAVDATPVAIGSGVINDLVKHAAFQLGRPYLCVATAASMDGYTSAGSPLSDRGFKKTIQCRPAKVVLADLDVIAAAPHEMTGWGYGDLSGKVPAGADWIVADALGIEAIDDVAWPMVQAGLADWLAGPERIARGDREALKGLFAGLTIVGLAMELHGSSRPASGADHQIAHLWEMENLELAGERVSHGACVAVGCLTSLSLYEWVLGRDLDRIDIERVLTAAPSLDDKIAAIHTAFGKGEIALRAIEETRLKHLDPAAHRARLTLIKSVWPDMKSRIAGHILPATEMAERYRVVGAPASAAEIGVNRNHLRRTTAHALFIRSRYTILDLLDETGLLEEAMDAVVPWQQDALRA